MGEWSEINIGRNAILKYGTMPRKDLLGKGIYPIFSGYKYQDLYPECNCKEGDLVVVARGVGGTGDVKIVKEDAYLTNLSIKIVFNSDIVDNNFFYFFFLKENLKYLDSGSAQSQITIKDLQNETFLFPPLPEQKSIASVLSSLDDKIDLLHRQNKTLEAMAETLFRQWFVEEAREDWEEGCIKDLIDIRSGFAFKSATFTEAGKYKLITIKAVQDGSLDLNNASQIDTIPSNMPPYCALSKGDILLSLTGNVGRCCLVDRDNLLLNQRVAKLEPKDKRDWAFTYIFFRQPANKRTLEDMAKGTAQSNLSPVETANMSVIVPSATYLEKFSQLATPILTKVLENKNQIQNLEKLRDTLLPKLMSGEVRVEYEN